MVEPSRKQRAQTIGTPLTTSKLNAVRAAFKAGVKPKQIGRRPSHPSRDTVLIVPLGRLPSR